MNIPNTPEENFIYNLINNVQNHRCLYDKGDAYYYNKLVKERAWESIAKQTKKTSKDCKHKWKSIRERYSRELRKQSMSSESGFCENPVEWELFNELEFLRDSVKQRDFIGPREPRHVNNIDEDGDTKDETAFFNEDSQRTSVTSISQSTPKRFKQDLDGVCDEFGMLVEKVENHLQPTLPVHSQTQSDGDEEFFALMLTLSKDLPVQAKDSFKAEMMNRVMQVRAECRQCSNPNYL